ncbi:MAG: hypothetical protein ACREAB_00375 [Blastocatellia bacterium]
MKCLALCSYLMLAVATNHVSDQDQDPWKKYQPRILDQIIKLHATKVLDNPEVLMTFSDGSAAVLTRDSFPSKVKITYTGQSRSIPQKRKELVKDWVTTTYGANREEYVKLFDTEFLFIEDSVEYWLPIQSQLIQPLKDELKKGEEVILYVAWIGARKESDKIDWVFLVNEFEKE